MVQFTPPSGPETTGVYFLKSPSLGRVKIGYTSNLFLRLRNLRSAVPDLEVACFLAGEGEEKERELHELFEEFRVGGEWYEVRGQLKAYIETRSEFSEDGEQPVRGDFQGDAISIGEATKILGVSHTSVHNYLKGGLLPYRKTKAGRHPYYRYYVSRAAVWEMKEQRRKTSRKPAPLFTDEDPWTDQLEKRLRACEERLEGLSVQMAYAISLLKTMREDQRERDI